MNWQIYIFKTWTVLISVLDGAFLLLRSRFPCGGQNYAMEALFLNYLRHILGIHTLQFLVTYHLKCTNNNLISARELAQPLEHLAVTYSQCTLMENRSECLKTMQVWNCKSFCIGTLLPPHFYWTSGDEVGYNIAIKIYLHNLRF